SSVAISQSAIWTSDKDGEHQISSEGFTALPNRDQQAGSIFSPDGKTLYYLVRRGSARADEYGELWAVDLTTGRSQRALADFVVTGYDVSSDGKRVLFSEVNNEGKSHVWVADLERRASPKQLPAGEADSPAFGPGGDVFFRATEGASNYVFRMAEDGSNRRKAMPDAIVYFNGISPDGAWVIAREPRTGPVPTPLVAYSLRGEPSMRIAEYGFGFWSRNGKFFYIEQAAMGASGSDKTYVFSLPARRAFPDLAESGFDWDKKQTGLVKVIENRGGEI